MNHKELRESNEKVKIKKNPGWQVLQTQQDPKLRRGKQPVQINVQLTKAIKQW